MVESYYDDGQLMKLFTLIDGKKEGLERWWWRNGQLWIKRTYINGKAEGLEVWWYQSGKVSGNFCRKAGEVTDMSYCTEGKQP